MNIVYLYISVKTVKKLSCISKSVFRPGARGHFMQHTLTLNSLKPNDAYMRQYNIPILLQKMACRLFGAKPLSEPMLPCYQLDPNEHIPMKFYLKFKRFLWRKCIEKCRLSVWRPFCLSLNVVNNMHRVWKMTYFKFRNMCPCSALYCYSYFNWNSDKVTLAIS